MGNGKEEGGDFLGGPVVKTHTSTAGDTGSIPVRELRSHIHIAQPKKKKTGKEGGRIQAVEKELCTSSGNRTG